MASLINWSVASQIRLAISLTALIFVVRLYQHRHLFDQINSDVLVDHFHTHPDDSPQEVSSRHRHEEEGNLLNGTASSPAALEILFVHVGKAGGETIKKVLEVGCKSRRTPEIRLECMKQLPDSVLSKLVKGYFHIFSQKPRKFKPNAILINVRHPVDRAISWYHYIHPDHCRTDPKNRDDPACKARWYLRNHPQGWVAQFFGCFPVVEAWANALQHNDSACVTLAQKTYQGNLNHNEIPLAAHMIANLRHYVNQTVRQQQQQAPVFVVRTESLWQDLKNLDLYLGGTGDFGIMEGSAVTHGSENHRKKNSLSNHSFINLCCALQMELEFYRELIQRATNLHDKKEELHRSVQRCGANSWQELTDICVRKNILSNTKGGQADF